MKRRETFWGSLFIIAAVLILLNQFSDFEIGKLNTFSILASVLLGGIAFKSLFNFNFWGVLFPLAFIGILFNKELGIETFTPWPILFTALCFSIGLSLLIRRPHSFGWHSHHDSSFGKNVINQPDDNNVRCSTSFGECIKYVNSEDFQKADIKCSFGAAKVYFDHAKVPSGKADIYVDVSFGEAKLYIPSDWTIINDIQVFCGDSDVTNKKMTPDAPVISIHGNVSFGDIKVYYV